MRSISNKVAGEIYQDFLIPYEIAFGTLMSMAYVYHEFVVSNELALLAYCGNKGWNCMALRGELNVVNASGSAVTGSGDGGTGSIFPPDLYERGFCFMPIYYKTCAYGTCIPDVLYLPCP
ncbi:hypothetical protein P2G88_01625 [Aliiglaciecola sp. CAU 1673]|uniref:hypothetical protein n=1 Tax=Aliiglaciecola sp. CAU 1673 TaxID=3032595 RepID=UPI0023DC17CD|nr:hypothetical protein [Aliiglaciecola sp. CAU 1673]MDF2176952.1 hypothetical protein [Aliiglaciecola sp. CAU 1673]